MDQQAEVQSNPPMEEKKCVICNRKIKFCFYDTLFPLGCLVFKIVISPRLLDSGAQIWEQKNDENNNPNESPNVGDIPDKGDTQTKEDNQKQIDNQKSSMSSGTKALIGGAAVGLAAVGTGVAVATKSKKGDVDVGKTEDSGPYMFLGNSNATSMANTGSSVDIAKGAELNGYSKNEATEQHVVYIVKPGDTLSEIAQKYGTSVSDLAKKNNIKDVNLIYPNQSITIR